MDYWFLFKAIVTTKGIQPSEFWKLDYKETVMILGIEQKEHQDRSFMVNEQRKANGMSEDFTNNGGELSLLNH